MENIIEQVREFVENECKKPTSKYGYEPYSFHFVPMHNYAKMLAEKIGADIELVEVAAWLHDIGSIIRGRNDHHITGAAIAEEKLRALGYPEEKIILVKDCILSHRGSVIMEKQTKEAKIIADADAMSNFDNIGGIFRAAYSFENRNQGEGIKEVLRKLTNCFNKLSTDEAKEIIRPKMEAAKLLFN